MIAENAYVQKPLINIIVDGTIWTSNQSKNIFIKILNIPNVTIIKGKVIIFKTGLKKNCIKASKKDIRIKSPNPPLNLKFSNKYFERYRPKAFAAKCEKNSIMKYIFS